METNEILHILRNPYGKSREQLRQVYLEAADKIEQLTEAYLNMREYAEKHGLDTRTVQYTRRKVMK